MIKICLMLLVLGLPLQASARKRKVVDPRLKEIHSVFIIGSGQTEAEAQVRMPKLTCFALATTAEGADALVEIAARRSTETVLGHMPPQDASVEEPNGPEERGLPIPVPPETGRPISRSPSRSRAAFEYALRVKTRGGDLLWDREGASALEQLLHDLNRDACPAKPGGERTTKWH